MKQYIVDAFSDRVFHGNPAAICILDQWLPQEQMMGITRENNLSETAFAVKKQDRYHLRWFTPAGEIDLCGHATLAAAFVVLTKIEPQKNTVIFETLSGNLTVTRHNGLYEMDFPAYELREVPVTRQMADALGAAPLAAYMGRDLMCVLESETDVKKLSPDLEKAKDLPGLLLHATAPGSETDCVSRTFAPKSGVPEDPVCGSGHCHIAPYWTARLQKPRITAYQASVRGGTLYCAVEGGRVKLSGKAALYAESEICLD